MIPYIGDLSINDAKVLKEFAKKSQSILEFGVGGSTQLLRHYSEGVMDSVDTSPEWIEITKQRMELVGVDKEVKYYDYDWMPNKEYDLIFVDGGMDLRNEFALNNWNRLKVGGFMLFHDTRRDWAVKYLSSVLEKFSEEIEFILLNENDSNISIIKKREKLIYENWNEVENRKFWLYSASPVILEEFEVYKQKQSEL